MDWKVVYLLGAAVTGAFLRVDRLWRGHTLELFLTSMVIGLWFIWWPLFAVVFVCICMHHVWRFICAL